MDKDEEYNERTEPEDDWLKELKKPGGEEKKVPQEEPPKKFVPQSARNEMVQYAGMASELFAAVLVGAIIGYFLDNLFGSKGQHGFLLGGMILGALGGFWNIYRLIVKEEQREAEARKKKE